jgi:hypothetical protein
MLSFFRLLRFRPSFAREKWANTRPPAGHLFGRPNRMIHSATIDDAITVGASRPFGLVALDVPHDNHCLFHCLKWWLPKYLGEAGALHLLNCTKLTQAAVRKFLCDWARESSSEIVLDDEGEDTVAQLAVRGAVLDWPEPIISP